MAAIFLGLNVVVACRLLIVSQSLFCHHLYRLHHPHEQTSVKYE